jgi:FkbM family methyltransferase
MKTPHFLPSIPPITIVDVGAMSIGEGKEAYAKLMAATECEVIGFEPQAAECEKLNASQQPGHTYLPFFIGDGQRRTFYECNYPATSSLFEPNTALLERFQNLANLTQVVRTIEVETQRLDDVLHGRSVDYLKVDVQGGEILVFSGAEKTLRDTLVIQTEVEFVPLYKKQPLFADIDAFLLARGFVFHRFSHLSGRAMQPLIVNNNVNAALSQTLWGDAIYVRDFMRLAELAPDQLLKLAVILHANYQSFDLAAHSLGFYDQKRGTKLFPAYVNSLVATPPGQDRGS